MVIACGTWTPRARILTGSPWGGRLVKRGVMASAMVAPVSSPASVPAGSSVVAGPARIRAIALEAVLVLAGFGLLAVLVTWPLAQHFGGFITAPLPGNDQLGYLFDFRYAAKNGLPVLHD